jgi:hypothetical protein
MLYGRIFLLILAALTLSGQQAQLGQEYQSLRPEQKRLIDEFIVRLGRAINQKLNPTTVYNEAPESQRTTFDAVTHALAKTKLSSADGKPLGTALDLVDSIDEIAGERRGESGDRQFRVYFFLKPGALDTLQRSREFQRGSDNSVYHRGYPICFRLDKTPSIQFSLSADHKRADVDVDYRSSKFPAGLVNGHLSASNSDVRAGKNEVKHNGRWDGLVAWWSTLFTGGGNAGAGPSERKDFPAVPPKGKGKVEEAVDDFFRQWLVSGNVPNAVSYFSRDSYPCLARDAANRKDRVEGGMTRVYLANRLAAFNRENGMGGSLSSTIQPVPAWSPDMKPVQQLSGDAYLLSAVPAGFAEAFDCDGDHSSNLGRGGAYLSSLRLANPKGKPQEFAFLWQKDGDYWRIVAATLLSADARATTLGTSSSSSAPRVIDVDGDPEFVRAATDFAEQWFLRKSARAALNYMLPEAFGCLDANSDTIAAPTVTGRRNQMTRGMNSLVNGLSPAPTSINEALQAPPPAQDGVRVVRHANRDSILLTELSDQAAAALTCSQRQSLESLKARIGSERTYGNHYISVFQFRTAGSPAVLVLAWKRDPKGWRVFFWQVETP